MKTMQARFIRHALVAGAIGLCQSAALAQSAAQIAEMEARFAAADKDGDGKLTPEEAKAGMPRVSKNFSKIDKGSKGFVTIEDIKDAMALMSGR
jgi:Ca2+-binding EF-hand superfamily protein